MQKVLTACALSAALIALVVYFVAFPPSGKENRERAGLSSSARIEELSSEVKLLKGSFSKLEGELQEILERLSALEGRLAASEKGLAEVKSKVIEKKKAVKEESPGETFGEKTEVSEGVTIPPFVAPYKEDFERYITYLIERERQRRLEEERKRKEALLKEIQELRKGPYGRFNMKVNSMAKVLDMTEEQKDRYYEISKAYFEALQELRKSIKWSDPEERKRYKGEQERLQKSYAEDVERILTAQQVEKFRALPAWSRNISNLGRVSPFTSQVISIDGNGGKTIYVESNK